MIERSQHRCAASGTERALWVRVAGVMLSLSVLGTPALAQEPQTRAEMLEALRADKAGQAESYQPGRLEQVTLGLEDGSLLEKYYVAPTDFHLAFGSITSGGGFAIGPAYRRSRLFGGHVDVVVSTQVSTKRYFAAQAALEMPRLAGERAFVRVEGGGRYLAQEDYFGRGPDSHRADRVSFAYRERAFGVAAGVEPVPWLTLGGGLSYVDPSIGRGRDERYPSIEEQFDDADTPGLTRQPSFLVARTYVDANYTEPEGRNPRQGGRYLAAYTRYDDREEGRYTFGRLDLELWQYLGVLHHRRVLALHAVVSTSDVESGRQVPFYFERTLGGANTLRGFREFRFRDAHLILLQAEYRWEIFPALDAAIFYDSGKVAARRRDLDFRDLERDWGFGFRFGSNRSVFVRIDSAFGSREGKHFFLKFGHVF